jgi:limonene-1,2-epoxide hydrolase
MSAENEKVVADFCQAWSRMKLDEILGFMSDDAVYHNIPMQPAKGKAAIRAVVEGFLKMADAIEFRVLHTASSGKVVMNERVDSFVYKGGKKGSIPVVGVFEVNGGKVTAWRDYFDMKMAGVG